MSKKKKPGTQNKSAQNKPDAQGSKPAAISSKPAFNPNTASSKNKKKQDLKTLSNNTKLAIIRSEAIWLLVIAAVLSLVCQLILKAVGIPFNGSVYEVIVFILVLILETRAIYLFSVIFRKDKPALSRNLILLDVAQAIIFAFVVITKVIKLVKS